MNKEMISSIEYLEPTILSVWLFRSGSPRAKPANLGASLSFPDSILGGYQEAICRSLSDIVLKHTQRIVYIRLKWIYLIDVVIRYIFVF